MIKMKKKLKIFKTYYSVWFDQRNNTISNLQLQSREIVLELTVHHVIESSWKYWTYLKNVPNYTKCIQKSCKTRNLYIFFVQRLFRSKFCMIVNAPKLFIKFLHIYKKCTNPVYENPYKFPYQHWKDFE